MTSLAAELFSLIAQLTNETYYFKTSSQLQLVKNITKLSHQQLHYTCVNDPGEQMNVFEVRHGLETSDPGTGHPHLFHIYIDR